MAGIRRNGALVMLICIHEAKREQLSLYYLNLFKLLCGLVETALLRALEYQEAVKDKQYVEERYIKNRIILRSGWNLQLYERTENGLLCSSAAGTSGRSLEEQIRCCVQ